MLNINLERLGEYLHLRRDIICAVVFGSSKDGKVKPGSDLDI